MQARETQQAVVRAIVRSVERMRRRRAPGESRLESRLAGCRAIVSRLKAKGSLRRELDPYNRGKSAVDDDVAPEMSGRLRIEREWSPEQYQEYVTNVLIGALTSSQCKYGPPMGSGQCERNWTTRRHVLKNL